ncbi:hypothetical protein [Blastomonas sp. SL216]|nr:hypothetical protein OU999_13920 [Blastomonas sp. SL216]
MAGIAACQGFSTDGMADGQGLASGAGRVRINDDGKWMPPKDSNLD